MAILVDFQKTREDSARVEYRFGHPELDRLLVIEKSTREGTPADGTVDRTYAAALTKILRLQRERETWPTGGTYAA
ncbi:MULTISPECIES: hypothetical protein [unclassified Pseudofrankia]|uniref:hypothetical protein n=1 Tax=unclassified Pseudofrankia TaxID=2994372 RepID=UPI0008D90E68|nr:MULTISPECIES: hypothetical protein [unclassified Pseudofrankia]MDT3445208.1 hypothetical protein [Pseudofrankia sp. BMG5.37]OHV63317.1 hypothetical protein BCD48_04930 [Pseudofrankia sp. BMG5.36]